MGHKNIIFGMYAGVSNIGESIIAKNEFDELDNEDVAGMK